MPRSSVGSRTHSVASATVERSRSRAPSRARAAPPCRPGPDAARTSHATACIDGVGLRWPAVVIRSRCRTSSATSRAGGVEDVDDGGLLRVGVPGGGGEDDAQAVVAGERVEPGGVAEAGRGAFGSAVADDLDGERVARQQGAPPGQRGLGLAAPPVQHGPADVGVGTEEDDERAGTIRRPRPSAPRPRWPARR